MSVAIPTRPARRFLPTDFQVTTWEALEPFFADLAARDLATAEALRQFLKDRSELESVIAEEMGWRYIRMTCYTENEEYRNAYTYFVQELQPPMAPYSDVLNKKVVASAALPLLEQADGYRILLRNLKKDIALYREENIPLFTEIQTKTQQYGQISGAMTVTLEGKELTLQQAAVVLMSTQRAKREEAYRAIGSRRLQDKEQLDTLYSELISLRHQVARNAGFPNFRDYQFQAYGRFDYSPKDCFQFHEAIASEVVPVLNQFARGRASKLGLHKLRPWDKAVDPEGRDPLKAFENGADLAQKSIHAFADLDPYLGECLQVMKAMGHLDLESRKGKAPGGYNYPLAEIGVPFIFMNATSTHRDMVTLMHEGGHAVHNFLTKDLELADFKSPPMEVAELASMSMELLSMDQWHHFFNTPEDVQRARQEQLEDLIETLPWVATIDAFQHWVYENPNHSLAARKQAWNDTFDRFADAETDWSGLQEYKDYLWQKQLHLYEVPFYYIEYGMAQLGAIAMWRNYRQNKARGLHGYFQALRQGNLKSIPEIYAAGGIRFDFSRAYIRELMQFVGEELTR